MKVTRIYKFPTHSQRISTPSINSGAISHNSSSFKWYSILLLTKYFNAFSPSKFTYAILAVNSLFGLPKEVHGRIAAPVSFSILLHRSTLSEIPRDFKPSEKFEKSRKK